MIQELLNEGVDMDFSEKVKKVRALLMLSQEDLAKQIGVSRVTITRWESQGAHPKFLALNKFETFCKNKGINL